MELDFGKLWVAAAAGVAGAIAGAWIWAQRAAAAAASAARAAGEDALLVQAQHTGLDSLAAALQGALVGGILGLLAAVAYLYFSDPDRGMRFRRVDTGDDRW